MRLVSLKLSPQCPYWFLGDLIKLSPSNDSSEYINIDSLEDSLKEVLDNSIKCFDVRAFDHEGNRITKLKDVIVNAGHLDINIEDVKEELNELPEIISITEEEEVEEEEEIIITNKDKEQAKFLLTKNGNTVKRTIKNIDLTDGNISFLLACFKLEQAKANRKSVVNILEEKIEVYYETRS